MTRPQPPGALPLHPLLRAVALVLGTAGFIALLVFVPDVLGTQAVISSSLLISTFVSIRKRTLVPPAHRWDEKATKASVSAQGIRRWLGRAGRAS